MNQLWNEGLLYEGSYTQSNDQAMALMENPDCTKVGVVTAGRLDCVMTVGSDNSYEYECLPPLAGPDGTQYSFYAPYGNARLGYYAISASCKDPVSAIKLADYMYSYEGTMNQRQGEKGVDWRDAIDGELGFYGQPALYARLTTWGGTQNKHWSNVGLWNETADMRAGTAIDNSLNSHDPLALQRFWEENGDLYWPYVPDISILMPPVRFTEEETDETSILSTSLSNAYTDWKVGFITGQYDIDTQWQDYLTELDTIGMQRWLELNQTAYDRYLKLQQ